MVENSIKRPSERPSEIRVINGLGASRVFIVEKHVPDSRRLFITSYYMQFVKNIDNLYKSYM